GPSGRPQLTVPALASRIPSASYAVSDPQRVTGKVHTAMPGSDPAEQLALEDFLELPPRSNGKPATAHIGRPPGPPNRARRYHPSPTDSQCFRYEIAVISA